MSVSVATQAAGAAAKRTRIKQSKTSRAFDVGNYFLLALLGLVTIGPFLYLVSASLTESNYYRVVGVSISPQHWTLDSYLVLLGSASRIYQALRITLFITAVGTALSLLTAAGLAYGLAQHEVPAVGSCCSTCSSRCCSGAAWCPTTWS